MLLRSLVPMVAVTLLVTGPHAYAYRAERDNGISAPTPSLELDANVLLHASVKTIQVDEKQDYPNMANSRGPSHLQVLTYDAQATAESGAEIQSVQVFATVRGYGAKLLFQREYGRDERTRNVSVSNTVPLACWLGTTFSENSVSVRMQVTLRTRAGGQVKVERIPVSSDQFLNFEKLPLDLRASPGNDRCNFS